MTEFENQPSYAKPIIKILNLLIEDPSKAKSLLSRFKKAIKTYESGKDETYTRTTFFNLVDISKQMSESFDGLLKSLAKQALRHIYNELRHSRSKEWLTSTFLEVHEKKAYFEFLSNENPKLGSSYLLYETNLEEDSFLLGALNGLLPKPSFTYDNLLSTLAKYESCQDASWIYAQTFWLSQSECLTEIMPFLSQGDELKQSFWLGNFEQKTPAPEQGIAYMFLIPESRRWLLIHSLYPSGLFTIEIHGLLEIINEITHDLGLT